MAFCPSCGAQLAEGAAFCAACGKAAGQPGPGTPPAAAPAPTAGGLTDNVAGMLAYVTIIPAIIFLVMEPYNRKPFVRFHAFQCIFFAVGLMVIHIGLMFIPFIGWITNWFVSLAALILWVVCLIKANQGQMFKIPVIGDIAEKQANAM